MALATGVKLLQISTFPGEPLIYPAVQNAIKKMKLLQFDIWLIDFPRAARNEVLNDQVIEFLKDTFAAEGRTKKMAMDERIDHRGQKALKWTAHC
jgi:hypothetical protein